MLTGANFQSNDLYLVYLAFTGTKEATSEDFKNKDWYQIYDAINV